MKVKELAKILVESNKQDDEIWLTVRVNGASYTDKLSDMALALFLGSGKSALQLIADESGESFFIKGTEREKPKE